MNDKLTDEARSKQDRLLDEALEETFPASDPISMQQIITVGRTERRLLDDAAKDRSVRARSGARAALRYRLQH